jgi:hypothetical protein
LPRGLHRTEIKSIEIIGAFASKKNNKKVTGILPLPKFVVSEGGTNAVNLALIIS